MIALCLQNMSAEELEEFHSKRSALAKRLWQDPDYVAKTVTAIQAAGQRRREASAQRAAEADADSRASSSAEGSSSASRAGSSSRSGTKSRRRAARTSSSSSQAAVSEAVVEASAEAEPPAPKEPRRAHTPAKKVRIVSHAFPVHASHFWMLGGDRQRTGRSVERRFCLGDWNGWVHVRVTASSWCCCSSHVPDSCT